MSLIELPRDPAAPLLGIYPDKTLIQKDACAPTFTATLFTIAKIRKQFKSPSTGWRDTEDVVNIYNGVLFRNLKKKWNNMPFAATWTALEVIVLSEVSQKEKN